MHKTIRIIKRKKQTEAVESVGAVTERNKIRKRNVRKFRIYNPQSTIILFISDKIVSL